MIVPVTPLPSVYDMDMQHIEAILVSAEAEGAFAIRLCSDGSVKYLSKEEYESLLHKDETDRV